MVKEKFGKTQKVSKYYDQDCLKNLYLLFMSILTSQIFKNSHFLAKIYLSSYKNVLDQTSKTFNTKFGPQ